jgi:hypothetical protein
MVLEFDYQNQTEARVGWSKNGLFPLIIIGQVGLQIKDERVGVLPP